MKNKVFDCEAFVEIVTPDKAVPDKVVPEEVVERERTYAPNSTVARENFLMDHGESLLLAKKRGEVAILIRPFCSE